MKKEYKIYEMNPFSKDTRFDERSFKTLMSLRDPSFRLLHYLAFTFRKHRLSSASNLSEDFKLEFDMADVVEKTNKSHTAIYKAIKDLEKNDIIARTKKHYLYFINPKFLIYGVNRRQIL